MVKDLCRLTPPPTVPDDRLWAGPESERVQEKSAR